MYILIVEDDRNISNVLHVFFDILDISWIDLDNEIHSHIAKHGLPKAAMVDMTHMDAQTVIDNIIGKCYVIGMSASDSFQDDGRLDAFLYKPFELEMLEKLLKVMIK